MQKAAMLYQDLDGEKELLVLTPFHGEDVKTFKKDENGKRSSLLHMPYEER